MDYRGDVVGKGPVGRIREGPLEKSEIGLRSGRRWTPRAGNLDFVQGLSGVVAPIHALVVFVERFYIVEESLRKPDPFADKKY